jgi:hypothetical protein
MASQALGLAEPTGFPFIENGLGIHRRWVCLPLQLCFVPFRSAGDTGASLQTALTRSGRRPRPECSDAGGPDDAAVDPVGADHRNQQSLSGDAQGWRRDHRGARRHPARQRRFGANHLVAADRRRRASVVTEAAWKLFDGDLGRLRRKIPTSTTSHLPMRC